MKRSHELLNTTEEINTFVIVHQVLDELCATIEENLSEKKKPRALSKSTKKFTRRVFDLRKRVGELKGCSLDESSSFYVPHWSLTTEHVVSLKNKPKENVKIMLNMVQLVRDLLKETFYKVSNPYVGKTCDLSARFKRHQTVKQKENHVLILVSLLRIQFNEIPEEDNDKYGMDTDSLTLLYEKMLIREMNNEGVKLFDDNTEAGGGGRGGRIDRADRDCFVYCLFSVSNK